MKHGARLMGWVILSVGTLAGPIELLRMRESYYPELHQDSVLFVSVASNIASGKGHTYSLFTQLYLRKHDWKYDIHGQLYPFALAMLSGEGNSEGIFHAVCMVNVFTFLAGIVWGLRLARILNMGHVATAGGAVLGGYAVAAIAMVLQGRPEHLIPFISCCAGVVRTLSTGLRVRLITESVEVGLVAACSPVPGGILLLFRYCSAPNYTGILDTGRYLTVLSVLSFLTWFLITLLSSSESPFRILSNSAALGGGVSDFAPRGYSVLHRVWLIHPNMPLVGVPLALASALLVFRTIVLRQTLSMKFISWSLLILLAGVTFRVSIYRYVMFYNTLPLIVSLSSWIVHLLKAEHVRSQFAVRWIKGLLGVSLIAIAGGFLRQSMVHEVSRGRGVSLHESRSQARALTAGLTDPHGRVAILESSSPVMTALVMDQRLFLSCANATDSIETLEKSMGVYFTHLIVRQDVAGEPVATRGLFTLTWHNWISEKPTFWGIPLNHVMPGYQIAVYRRSTDS